MKIKNLIFKNLIYVIIVLCNIKIAFCQIGYERKFVNFFNSQSFAGKINTIDTLNGDQKIKCYPLVKIEIEKIKQKAITDNKTDIIDKILFIEGEMYFLNRNYYKCIPIFIDLFAKSKIKTFTDSTKAFYFLKNSFIATGSLNKAIEAHKILIDLKVKHPTISQWKLEPNLSSIYYEMKSYKECLKQQLIEYEEIKKDSTLLLGFYNNRGLFWVKFGGIDSALNCYNKAKIIFLNLHKNKSLKPEDEFVIGLIEGNIGQAFMGLKQYSKAIPLLKKDVISSLKVNNNYNAAISQLELSKCYLSLNQLDISKKYLDSANLKFAELEDFKFRINILKQYSIYYQKAGSLAVSLNYINKYINFKDSLDNQQNIEELVSAQIAYQIDEKENLILNDQLKIKEKTIEIEKQQNIKNLLLLSGSILLLIIGSILYQLKKSNSQKQLLEIKNKQIETRNEIINKSLLEKDLLIKEVHHRVKNNLQIISSLLKLQSGKTNNDEIKNSLSEAQNRINSMAILHQLLYRNNEMTSLMFDEYLENLIIQISNSISLTNKNIRIETDLIKLELDLDTAIPLGLITNELISNAYKHAFNDQKGIIKIELSKLAKNIYKLKISDNGIGLDDNFNISNLESLGLDIVTILSEQINAELKIYNNEGANFEIIFKIT